MVWRIIIGGNITLSKVKCPQYICVSRIDLLTIFLNQYFTKMAKLISIKDNDKLESHSPSYEKSLDSTFVPEERDNHSCHCPCLGLFLAVLSSLCFASASLIVKYMMDTHPVQHVFYRFIGVFLPSVFIIGFLRINPFPQGYRLHIVFSSLAGCISLSLQYYAFQHMQLGGASVIIVSTAVFVTLSERIFLKEKFSFIHLVAILTSISGVVLAIHSSETEDGRVNELGGILAAASSIVFSSAVYICLRLMKDLHFACILTSYSLISLSLTSLVSVVFQVFRLPTSPTEYGMLSLMAVFCFAGHYCFTAATKLDSAGLVALGRTTDIVFAYLFQIYFFHEIPTLLSLLGMILVSFSVVVVVLYKWLAVKVERPIIKH